MEPVTIHALHDKLVKGEISAVELTRKFLDRKDKVEPTVRAFLSDNREFALAAAALTLRIIFVLKASRQHVHQRCLPTIRHRMTRRLLKSSMPWTT